jgi:hypothetical protein
MHGSLWLATFCKSSPNEDGSGKLTVLVDVEKNVPSADHRWQCLSTTKMLIAAVVCASTFTLGPMCHEDFELLREAMRRHRWV